MRAPHLLLALAALASACDPAPPIVVVDGGGTSTECSSSQSFCSGRCIPTSSNPLHCGACGNVCASNETCEDGSCRSAVTCTGGQRDCGGGCTDVSENLLHCGRCGEECADGESCISGGCVPETCPAEQPSRCGDGCTDTQSDNSNCGDCTTKCTSSQTCESGVCAEACDGTSCEVDGADVCVDTQSNPAHCGGCNTACDDGQACSGGTCACSTGQTECGGRCVDTSTDPAHCGTCDVACDAGSACDSGSCACASGLTQCGPSCVNTAIDSAHCGGCESPCSGGQTCAGGTCTASCGTLLTQCGAVCVDTAVASGHCGACDNACGDALGCSAGVCRPENDDRLSALELTFPTDGSEITQRGSTDGATPDLPALGCAANGPNIWYRVTVPADGGVLWADTAASGYDTAIFVTDESGVQVSGMCNDDCDCDDTGDFGFLESCTARYVVAGVYYVSVGGYSIGETGDFTLHLQFLPDTGFTYQTRLNDTGTTLRTFLLDASEAAASCGGPGSALSGEDTRWFASCGGAAPHHLSLCPEDGGLWTRNGSRTGDEGEIYDPVMTVVSAQTGTEIVCNDDDLRVNCSPEGGGPRFGSRIRDLMPGRGVHGARIDSRTTDGGGMHYQLRYELPELEL